MGTLKFQIVVALLLMATLFVVAILYALQTIERQRMDDLSLRIGNEMRLIQQEMNMQAISYKENAPRDYPTYYRDTRLYYQRLRNNRERLDEIISAFSSGQVPATLRYQHDPSSRIELSPQNRELAIALQGAWEEFNNDLEDKLGDPDEPRLEWGAEWILSEHPELEQATASFLASLQQEIVDHTEQTQQVGRFLLIAGLLVALLIVLWFYRTVLKPLEKAVKGFRQVATGDFSHRVQIHRQNEIGWLITVFNQLTERLDGILGLLTGLEKSKALEDSLETLSQVLPPLVPVDWVGMLLLGVDGNIRLERAYADGKTEDLAEKAFELEGSLLQECLENGVPLHIPNVADTARLDDHFRFLSLLASRGRHDAVFMPILGNEPKVGVLVLASRHPNSYRTEHIQLLHNLSALFSATFGRTVALVESSRLANIGQFASGIVHEIRTPLGTIGMALEHLIERVDLPKNTQRRVTLAYTESKRLGRLLDDILLYAKPLDLHLQPARLEELFAELEQAEFAQQASLHIDHETLQELPELEVDRDRILQVFINLLRNAIDACGQDPRGIHLEAFERNGKVEVDITNGGATITDEQLQRVFQPFYTTKPSGTGLGLPIVRRIVEAHGGEIEIESNEETGTRVRLQLLPRMPV